jgi:SulP family sulfate permease
MAISMVGIGAALNDRQLRPVLIDIFAGAIASFLSIAYCLSYAALIFTGPLAQYLAYGVAVSFLSAAVAGAIVAWRSSLRFAIAGPDSSSSVVIAAMVATLVHRLTLQGSTDLLLPTVLAMTAATALTGALLSILGFTRAGRAIRYVPFPVIGGFLGATGLMMITGAAQVISDQKLTFANLTAYASPMIGAKLGAGIVIAVTLYVITRRAKSPFVFPGVLLSAIAITYLAMIASGVTLVSAQAAGWMFQPQPASGLVSPWGTEVLRQFPLAALPSLAADILAVMFVTVTTILLNTTGIELATHTEADIERDLKALGVANLLSAIMGGYVSCISLSRSLLVRAVGATSRLAGFTVAAISAALLVADPAFLGYVPKYVLGGLLFFLGAGLVYQWLIQTSRKLSRIDYLSLIAIAILIVNWGFIGGVLIGIVIGCATFAFSASRVNAIKFSFDGSEYRSSLDRGPHELAILAEYGSKIQGMALQSYLFFGSANQLYQHVKALVTRRPECRFLIFDFHRVTGIDSSATQSFAQIKQAAADAGAKIVLVNLTPEIERAFRTARFITDDIVVAADLDRALEACEQQIIDTHRGKDGESRSLRTWLSESLGDPALAESLATYCRRLDVEAGDVIARQGDAAPSMHFIVEGRVGIIVEAEPGRTMRVRSLGRHTTVGEMGLIAQRPRSATIKAETASVLYELDADAFARIKRENPALSQALLAYVIAVMTERLSFANRVIGVLQR